MRGRDVLLVDDILDTGKTMSRVLPKIRALKPRRIKTCVLLDKPARRAEDIEADFVGFEIPDFFVVGYGLDFAERYRNLPFVGVLHPHIYKEVIQRVIERNEHQITKEHRIASFSFNVLVSWWSNFLPMHLHFANLFGWAAMLLLAWGISYNRKNFPWRTVLWGLGLQLTLAILDPRHAVGRKAF